MLKIVILFELFTSQYKTIQLFNLLNPILANNENISELTNEELLDKYLSTQKSYYFDIIYKRLSKKVYAKCISFLKSETEAKDAMQDIFVTILLKASKFQGKSKLSTWVYTITYNHCVDLIRKKKRGKQVLVDDWSVYEGMPEVDDRLLLETKVEHLKVILEKISVKDKMILMMKYQDDMKIKEMSEVLDKTESAVKMGLNRAKQRFREYHEKMNFN